MPNLLRSKQSVLLAVFLLSPLAALADNVTVDFNFGDFDTTSPASPLVFDTDVDGYHLSGSFSFTQSPTTLVGAFTNTTLKCVQATACDSFALFGIGFGGLGPHGMLFLEESISGTLSSGSSLVPEPLDGFTTIDSGSFSQSFSETGVDPNSTDVKLQTVNGLDAGQTLTLDNLQEILSTTPISAAPEPAAIGLLGAGILTGAFLLRRRQG